MFKTMGGHLWLLVGPLSHIAIYYFLIVIIFSRGGGGPVNPFIMIMTGLVHYLFFQRTLMNSCRAILSNETLVMQIPIEPLVFCAVNFLKNSIDFMITLLVFGLFYALGIGSLQSNMLWYPFLLLLLAVIIWCWSVSLAVLTVFFRDMQNLSQILLRLLLYLSPVIYTLDFVPEYYQGVAVRELYVLNPIAALFGYMQWSLLGGELPPVHAGMVLLVFILLSMGFSSFLYRRYRNKITKAF